MNIILCGLQKSGKSTIGKIIARKLSWQFIDTDLMIQEADPPKRACRQICHEEGEAHFRTREKQQILALKEVENSVIALGGGSLMDPESLKIVLQLGHCIYLKAPLEMLWSRMKTSPAYLDLSQPKQSFYEIAKMRIPIFEKGAHKIIETDTFSSKEQIAWEAIHSAPFLKSQRGVNLTAKPSEL